MTLAYVIVPDYGFGSIVRVYDGDVCVGVFDTMSDAVVGMLDYQRGGA